jgi:hypothetical protein
MECTAEFDDTEVSATICSIAFFTSTPPGRDLSQFWVVDFARSISLVAFRIDFVSFDLPSSRSRVGGVGVDVRGSGSVEIAIPLVSGQIIRRTVHALCTPYLSARCAQCIGRLLSVSWMQSHSGCEFLFPTDSDIDMLLVPT